MSSYSFGTRAIHVGSDADTQTGAVIPPISLSTTFKQESVGVHKVSGTCHLFFGNGSEIRLTGLRILAVR
jgi:cystathionine beta-lyase/cystathionine gamma-synthase